MRFQKHDVRHLVTPLRSGLSKRSQLVEQKALKTLEGAMGVLQCDSLKPSSSSLTQTHNPKLSGTPRSPPNQERGGLPRIGQLEAGLQCTSYANQGILRNAQGA